MSSQAYFGTQISPHQHLTPEGYLVAQGVKLARSGWQTYYASELDLPGSELVSVFRPPEEVLARSFLASLRGKELCDGHPSTFVNSHNSRWLCGCGHVENIRQGPDLPDGNVTVVGDVFVKDEALIQKIRAGMTKELSVGYEYRLIRGSDGRYEMADLRANHVAVVGQARGGHQLQIEDSCSVRCCSNQDDTAVINFAMAARRYLGRNVLVVGGRR